MAWQRLTLKRIYRKLSKKIIYFFLFLLSKLFIKFDFKIIPSFAEIKDYNFEYSKNTRRLIYKPSTKGFPKLIIDTTHYTSNLCKLGSNFGTNKSPLNVVGHRSGYTPFYDHLFNHLKDKKINFAEIGIEANASTRMWRKYFLNAKIYGFEYEDIKIDNAKKHKLKNTFYKKIDVSNQKNIKKAFSKTKIKFDIIIDDSTHYFDHQINVIKNVHSFINEGGILVIEDIYKNRKNYSEDNYYYKLKNIKKLFKKIYFVEIHNLNNFTASWKNEKILILIK